MKNNNFIVNVSLFVCLFVVIAIVMGCYLIYSTVTFLAAVVTNIELAIKQLVTLRIIEFVC